LRRYHFRHIRCAAAYLGISHKTLKSVIHLTKPKTRIIEGLVMLPHMTWRALETPEARAHAEMRMDAWATPRSVGHGEAKKLEAEWRAGWRRRDEKSGKTVWEIVHGKVYHGRAA
jgi:hypothetical protein